FEEGQGIDVPVEVAVGVLEVEAAVHAVEADDVLDAVAVEVDLAAYEDRGTFPALATAEELTDVGQPVASRVVLGDEASVVLERAASCVLSRLEPSRDDLASFCGCRVRAASTA